MQTLIALFNRAQGLRTYIMGAAAVLVYVAGLLDFIPDAASQKVAGMFVVAAVSCFRLSLTNSDKTFDQKLSSLTALIEGKPDPNPPTADELEAIVKNAVARLLPPSIQIHQPPADEPAAKAA